MFNDTRQETIGSKTWYTVPLTMLIQALAVAALVIGSIMATGATPLANFAGPETFFVHVPPPPPPPPPPVSEEKVVKPDVSKDAAPLDTPKEIRKETGNETLPEKPIDVPSDKPGTVPGGGSDVIPTPPPSPVPPSDIPVVIGGNIKPPQKTYHVNPVYPQIAQAARVQGVVIIKATIGPDGVVRDATILRSIPLLDQAALDAVYRWTFTPTLLNNKPVPVVMTVTVQFALR